MTSFANQMAPEGSATTTTALAFTVTDGIGMESLTTFNLSSFNFITFMFPFQGMAIGAYISGSVYQIHGASFTFACFGTFAVVRYEYSK